MLTDRNDEIIKNHSAAKTYPKAIKRCKCVAITIVDIYRY